MEEIPMFKKLFTKEKGCCDVQIMEVKDDERKEDCCEEEACCEEKDDKQTCC